MGDGELQLLDLCADQKSVPEALQAVVDDPLLAIKETELEDEAIEKIGGRADLEGNAIVELFLQETLDRRLQRASARGQVYVPLKEISALVEDVDCLACRVLVVLVGEESQVTEVVICESSLEGHGPAAPHDHMLIHPAVFDSAPAAAPDAQQDERVTAT